MSRKTIRKNPDICFNTTDTLEHLYENAAKLSGTFSGMDIGGTDITTDYYRNRYATTYGKYRHRYSIRYQT